MQEPNAPAGPIFDIRCVATEGNYDPGSRYPVAALRGTRIWRTSRGEAPRRRSGPTGGWGAKDHMVWRVAFVCSCRRHPHRTALHTVRALTVRNITHAGDTRWGSTKPAQRYRSKRHSGLLAAGPHKPLIHGGGHQRRRPGTFVPGQDWPSHPLRESCN